MVAIDRVTELMEDACLMQARALELLRLATYGTRRRRPGAPPSGPPMP